MIWTKQQQTDKVLSIVITCSFLFWFLAKIPYLWDYTLFGVFYEMGALITMVSTLLITFYFLVRWVMNRFSVNKMHLYVFLLGGITLLMMRFVYSISFSGITLF